MGAASVKDVVADGAKPFDTDRNGTILGSGAVSLVIEQASSVHERGLNGQAEILGTYIGNSAFHATRIDVDHLSGEMNGFMTGMEKRHGLQRKKIAKSMVFMSHETYTPARGGSADAEIAALRQTFGQESRDITITNTKGYTGHTLGAAIEDAVLVKALQQGRVPPIANLKKVPPEFADLKLIHSGQGDFRFGLHFSAGFGSHFSFLFIKRVTEKGIENNAQYNSWLKQISGYTDPVPVLHNNTLYVAKSPDEKDSSETVDAPVGEKPAIPPLDAGVEKRHETSMATQETAEALIKSVQGIIARQTGYTEDMLAADLDLEADLGIDTVKQVEVFGKISSHFNLPVPEDLKLRELNTIARLADYIAGATRDSGTGSVQAAPAAGEPNQAAPPAILSTIRDIIAKQTGYTEDMLAADLDLEADLGIDTVKQVEVFGKVSSHFNLPVPEDLKLRELNTIARLADYIASETGGKETGGGEVKTAAEAQEVADSSAVLSVIRDIIARQTGYTEDMLAADLDLEADLGIDTVKQVEVFGKVSSHFNLPVPEDLKLRELNTIARLADYIAFETSGSETGSVQGEMIIPPESIPAKDTAFPASGVRRFVVQADAVPLPEDQINIFKDHTFLITPDRFGFAEAIGRRISSFSGHVLTMGSDASADINVDLSDIQLVEERLQTLGASHPEIKGLIHLHPLNAYLDGGATDSREMDASVKSFFLMVKQLLPLLDRPDGLISTLTFESIVFPYADSPGNIHPVFGALGGMLKTMNKELKNTLVKAVDFSVPNPVEQVEAIVDQYLAELMSPDRHVETGYRDNQKYTLSLVEKAVESTRGIVKKGDTVLVTGGARGITFEILKALATDYKVRLIILGRSDINALEADFKRDGADEAYIFGCLKSRMKGAKPVAIKRAVAKMMALKEGLANLAELSSRGIDVQYHCVDVLEAKAVLKIVDAVSPIDGVLHAAGVEESQFIQKKSLDSFNRVFDTKITGARNLLASLDGKAYRFFLTFSSVTAKFGNEGQVDYTGANDMLAKMLLNEKARHPEKMYKVFDWTAWDGAGMATKETVKKVLEQRGLEFLPLARGVKFFMDELYDAGSIEAVFTGRDTALDPDGLFQTPGLPAGEHHRPFIDDVVAKGAVQVSYARTLDLKRDLFLLDHSRLDVPIFLGATGIEAMAEAAATLAPEGSRLVSMRDFSIPYGIKLLKGRSKEILINASQNDGDIHDFTCSISSQFKNPQGQAMGAAKRHYQGQFAFSAAGPEQVGITIPEFFPVQYDGNIQDLLYHPSRLFMDGLFRTVEDILSFEPNVLISKVRNSSQKPFFAGDAAPDFITDVAIVDAMFQTGGMLEVMTTHEIVLPARIRQMDFYGPLRKNKAYFCITRKTDNGPKANTYQLDLVDTDGLLLIRIEDFEMVKVDRLAPENRITDKISSPALKKAS
jgi:acyl carrier protein/NAD(P)-dependent dehydrogenase (short-subunit alcohol dehydrogenase family)